MNPLCLGLDIGTTTISAVVLDPKSGSLIASRTVKSEADIPSPYPWEKIQDAALIEKKVTALLEELLAACPNVGSIGITGQMHGIVYLNEKGKPVSPLYTWQDQRSAELCPRLYDLTGYHLSAGYGLATHCALQKAGAVPPDAWKISTIMDYIAFSLCGRRSVKIHATNAASLGFFSLQEGSFDKAALEKAGIHKDILPEMMGDNEIQGYYRNIPVAAAIGDNQASFFGSVAQQETMALANFGTGSQISLLTRDISHVACDGAIEIRPFLSGLYLVCGSALCGGRAYALLERFFREYAKSCGLPEREQYSILNALAEEGLCREALPEVNTTFCGTRADPTVRGSILGLGEENLHPAALTAGTLLGMARELRQMFEKMPGEGVSTLVASGNAIRKNPALKKALEMVFGLPVRIPVHQEEAAFGAALFGAVAAKGILKDHLAPCIHYTK